MCFAKCGAAPRESLGTPLRYLPVKTPRANGAHAKKPKPHSTDASISSYSADLFSSEYSLCTVVRGAFIEFDCCLVAALANCHPEKLLIPT